MEQIEPPHRLSRFKAYWDLDTSGSKVIELVVLGPKHMIFPKTVLSAMADLQKLTLSEVRLADDIWSYISQIKLLQELVVSRSDVTGVGIGNLVACKSLKSLKLTATNVSSQSLKELPAIVSIAKLDLLATKVDDLLPLVELPNLTFLCLTQTRIGDKQMSTLGDCRKLTHLQLEGTRLTDAGLEKLLPLQSLRSLEVQNTNLGKRAYEIVSNLSNLEDLYIDKEIDEDAINSLRRLKNLKRLFVGGIPEIQRKNLMDRLGIRVF